MDGPNPSEMDIKVLTSALTSHLTNTALFLDLKTGNLKIKKSHGMLADIMEI